MDHMLIKEKKDVHDNQDLRPIGCAGSKDVMDVQVLVEIKDHMEKEAKLDVKDLHVILER